ncbi:hypothetical protein R1flu_021480 [Riccia fluitans]|uniref:Uncharacterized protein n=1 Tax=Riccia fluitans TaxID=41844 RepID=A0ABD1ZQ11_9MARC
MNRTKTDALARKMTRAAVYKNDANCTPNIEELEPTEGSNDCEHVRTKPSKANKEGRGSPTWMGQPTRNGTVTGMMTDGGNVTTWGTVGNQNDGSNERNT